jgi:hypothetical protein
MRILVILFFVMALLCADEFPKVYNGERNQKREPISPDAAARAFQVPAGFKVTVFAAEPEVRNPIAMAWDVEEADVGCRKLYIRRKGKTI